MDHFTKTQDRGKKMKTMLPRVGVFVFCVALFVISATAQTSSFSYQGRLNDGAAPANGTYQMQFSLWDAVGAGTQQGSTITNMSVSVVNGIFTVQLDFTAAPFASGADRWVEVAVRKAADPPGYTTLAPRQQLTSAPYATRSATAGTATTAGNVTGVVAVANGGTGSATGDGSSLNNLNATNLATGTVADARLSTNVTVQGNTFNGATQLVQTNGAGQLPAVSGVNLTGLNATNLATGTVADTRLSTNVTVQGNTFNGATQLVQTNGAGQLPAVSGVNLTGLNATNLASGTVADARLSTNVTVQGNTFNGATQLVQTNGSGQLPAVSGVNLTNLNASNLASGTVNTARLGTGTANSTTYLRGDNSWQTISTGGVTGSGTTDYVPKFTGATAVGNSVLQGRRN